MLRKNPAAVKKKSTSSFEVDCDGDGEAMPFEKELYQKKGHNNLSESDKKYMFHKLATTCSLKAIVRALPRALNRNARMETRFWHLVFNKTFKQIKKIDHKEPPKLPKTLSCTDKFPWPMGIYPSEGIVAYNFALWHFAWSQPGNKSKTIKTILHKVLLGTYEPAVSFLLSKAIDAVTENVKTRNNQFDYTAFNNLIKWMGILFGLHIFKQLVEYQAPSYPGILNQLRQMLIQLFSHTGHEEVIQEFTSSAIIGPLLDDAINKVWGGMFRFCSFLSRLFFNQALSIYVLVVMKDENGNDNESFLLRNIIYFILPTIMIRILLTMLVLRIYYKRLLGLSILQSNWDQRLDSMIDICLEFFRGVTSARIKEDIKMHLDSEKPADRANEITCILDKVVSVHGNRTGHYFYLALTARIVTKVIVYTFSVAIIIGFSMVYIDQDISVGEFFLILRSSLATNSICDELMNLILEQVEGYTALIQVGCSINADHAPDHNMNEDVNNNSDEQSPISLEIGTTVKKV